MDQGDANGNRRVTRFRLPSGLEIIGLPTPNSYGGEWDLGPTWNYLILTEHPILVDTGRYGTTTDLVDMINLAGLSEKEVTRIVISHGHEDHDGGVAKMAEITGAPVLAHRVYDRLCRFYPDLAPEGSRKDFPAGCWHCHMPKSFSDTHCLDYQREGAALAVEAITEDGYVIENDVTLYHIPGHSPDSLAVKLGSEAMLVGDTVLPQITPWPTSENMFEMTGRVLAPDYSRADEIYGLKTYLKSLQKLSHLNGRSEMAVFPAHRLYYGGQWQVFGLKERINELYSHHIARCSSIMAILGSGPKSAREISKLLFSEAQLKGAGIFMADNEVTSHCELLAATNDVDLDDGPGFATRGTSTFVDFIKGLS
jgi:glyoxylase-like metal-dependent hydrolase (beta-lactamase superfamily II)